MEKLKIITFNRKASCKVIHCKLSVMYIQFSSVAKSCPTLCNLMDCNMPGFPVLHHLQEFTQTHAIESVMPNHLILCHPLLLLPAVFPSTRFFSSGGQSIGASSSAAVLPMIIQGWFPLMFTGLISLLSRGFSRVYQHQSLKTSVLQHSAFLCSNSHTCTWLLENHSFDSMNLCWQNDVSAF